MSVIICRNETVPIKLVNPFTENYDILIGVKDMETTPRFMLMRRKIIGQNHNEIVFDAQAVNNLFWTFHIVTDVIF